MLRSLLTVLACLAIAACTTPAASDLQADRVEPMPVAAGPIVRSASDEAKYMGRFNALVAAFQSGVGLESYDPLEEVPGVADPQPLPQVAAGQSSIAPAALAEAREYAAKNNSFALLVWRDGALQSSDYFGETTRETPIIARSLAKPLTAAAIGRAIELG